MATDAPDGCSEPSPLFGMTVRKLIAGLLTTGVLPGQPLAVASVGGPLAHATP